MQNYVRQQTAVLLRRLAFQVSRAAKSQDPDSVHDLRTAIRRFSRCLRVFSQFYPGKSWKKIRERLRGLMRSAGAVRDLDIAMELIREAGAGAQSPLLARLRDERRDASRQLQYQIRLWKNRGFSKKWRTHLNLSV
jgi:CHAD domain-containing protein